MTASSYLESRFGIIISKNTAALIDSSTPRVQFPAGRIVLHEGDKASKLFLILKGLVRGYYIDDAGNDITKCFSSEHEYFSTEGLRTNQSSSFSIECIEECSCIQFPYTLIHRCIEKDSRIKDLVNALFVREVAKLEERARKLMVMNAEERYAGYMAEYPDLQNRIPLKYAASYIGIRPASLSRIRKNCKTT